MRKKIFAIILLITVLIVSIIVIMINKKENDALLAEKILIEYSFYNRAWGFMYYGEIICESGNIYKFEFTDADDYDNTTTLSDLNKNILKNVTESVGTVSDSDLKLIKEYGELVNDDDDSYEITYPSMRLADSGEETIKLYRNNKRILLDAYDGYYYKENKDDYASKILNILEKYNIIV